MASKKYVVPDDHTFFSAQKKTFDDVPIGPAPDSAIPTAQFIEAAEAYSNMFLLNDSYAFTFVHGDLYGNVKKIRDEFLKNPVDSESIQSLATSEQKRVKKAKEAHANSGLFWLTQNLIFTSNSIKEALDKPHLTMSESFSSIYVSTLKPWHGYLGATATNLALKAVPSREAFIPLLGKDESKVKEDMVAWLAGLEKVIAVLGPFVEKVIAPYLGLKKSK